MYSTGFVIKLYFLDLFYFLDNKIIVAAQMPEQTRSKNHASTKMGILS